MQCGAGAAFGVRKTCLREGRWASRLSGRGVWLVFQPGDQHLNGIMRKPQANSKKKKKERIVFFQNVNVIKDEECFRPVKTRPVMTQYGAWFGNVTGSTLEDGRAVERHGALAATLALGRWAVCEARALLICAPRQCCHGHPWPSSPR